MKVNRQPLRIMVIAVFGSLLLFSCGPTWHLNRARYHIALAGELGAKLKSDTVWRNVVTKETSSDTIVKFKDRDRIFTDTITIETTKWKTKTKYDTITKTIFQQVDCKPDTIRVAVVTKTDIKAGHTDFVLIISSVISAIVFLIIGIIVARWIK